MSSGGWEKVGGSKAKNKGHNNNKYSKTEKKKFAEKAPKLEDVRKWNEIPLASKLMSDPFENNSCQNDSGLIL